MRGRLSRRVVKIIRRRVPEPEPVSYLMDYGPDWPPRAKRRPTAGARLLRRCVAWAVVYALIFGLGVVLLEVRALERHGHPSSSVTTYTTTTAGQG